MLKIKCSPSITDDVAKVLIEEFAKISCRVSFDTCLSGFRIKKEKYGLSMRGMNYCCILKVNDTFSMIDYDDMAPKDAFAEIKKRFPEIEIKGSLLMGDDNYRRFYWYESASGSLEIFEDYAIGVNEHPDDKEGIPVSKCWFSYEYCTDYGIEHCAFPTEADFFAVLEEYLEYDYNEDDEEMRMSKIIKRYAKYNLDGKTALTKKLLKNAVNKAAEDIEKYRGKISFALLSFMQKLCNTEEGKRKLALKIENHKG